MNDSEKNSWEYHENLERECQTLERQVYLKSQNIQRLIKDICSLKKNIEEFRTQRSWLTGDNTTVNMKNGTDLSAEVDRLLTKTDNISDLIHILELEKTELDREHKKLKEKLKEEQAIAN